MTKEQIIINANTLRLKELRLELNALRLSYRHNESRIKAEAKKLEDEIKILEGMMENPS